MTGLPAAPEIGSGRKAIEERGPAQAPMKATLHHAVPPAAIPARLPPLFRTLIDPKRLGTSPVTLAVFPATSAAVVSANAARRLLDRLGDVSDPLVVVGYNFTQDAVEVLRDARATLFAVSNFWWSDARWQAIRER